MTNIIEEKDWPEMAQTLQKFLACPCQYFAPMRDDEPIWQAYQAARERGRKEGFTPVLLTLEENLLESCLYNTLPDYNDYPNFDLAAENFGCAVTGGHRGFAGNAGGLARMR
mgnify:CR=1 FL=1